MISIISEIHNIIRQWGYIQYTHIQKPSVSIYPLSVDEWTHGFVFVRTQLYIISTIFSIYVKNRGTIQISSKSNTFLFVIELMIIFRIKFTYDV